MKFPDRDRQTEDARDRSADTLEVALLDHPPALVGEVVRRRVVGTPRNELLRDRESTCMVAPEELVRKLGSQVPHVAIRPHRRGAAGSEPRARLGGLFGGRVRGSLGRYVAFAPLPGNVTRKDLEVERGWKG